jgi:hypothetical protein
MVVRKLREIFTKLSWIAPRPSARSSSCEHRSDGMMLASIAGVSNEILEFIGCLWEERHDKRQQRITSFRLASAPGASGDRL